jgi:pyrimidine operon attenuation protein/uracil phosphoribosyltransferase
MKNPGTSQHSGADTALHEKGQLMSSSEIDRTLVRLAHEIVERNNGAAGVVFVGILRRGVALAERLAKRIAEIEKVTPPVGKLDITSYRDDLSPVDRKSIIRQSDLPFPMEDKNVILVDDVLYTGRSIRAALDALVDHGRPRRVELCVLIDRGHRELPIQPDYVGRVVQTTESESVEVHLREVDREERVVLCEKVSGH